MSAEGPEPALEPIGAPADPLRPTGRVRQGMPPAPASLAKARRTLVVLAIALVLLPILLWLAVLLLVGGLG